MKTIELEIPDGKRAEWVNGVLTLVDDKLIEYKFNVGDKVKAAVAPALKYTITGQFAENGEPMYKLSDGFGETSCPETWLVSQDITERIKTFEDAYDWCVENGEANLVNHYDDWEIYNDTSKDIIAYLKLRIITCALNEGCMPTGREMAYIIRYSTVFNCADANIRSNNSRFSSVGVFKTKRLATYAAKQFRDIYADFCGCEKGGEA